MQTYKKRTQAVSINTISWIFIKFSKILLSLLPKLKIIIVAYKTWNVEILNKIALTNKSHDLKN